MRFLPVILVWMLAAPVAPAQTATEWLDRWARGQRSALADVESVSMVERAGYTLESASGRRRMGLTSRFTYGAGRDRPVRDVLEITFDGRPVQRPDSEQRRRRYENPLQEGMQQAVDLLMHPIHLLGMMNPPDTLEMVEQNDRPLVSIRTRAHESARHVARAIWWLDPEDGRLVQARAFVENEEGGALDVFVRYARTDGLDLPVRKRVEGSFFVRRRMRSFTVLVDARADIEEHDVTRR